jgi:hypothetical protein
VRRGRLAVFALALAAALVSPDLGARPGGGQSFKGPSRSSSSGSSSRPSSPSRPSGPSSPSSPSSPHDGGSSSSSSGSSFAGFFSWAFTIGRIAVYLLAKRTRHNEGARAAEWESRAPVQSPPPPVSPRAQVHRSLIDALGAIRERDPEFSFVLFEDFLGVLYTEAHMARGRGTLANLSPYLSADARAALAGLGGARVSSILVGTLKVKDVRADGTEGPTIATAIFESNYEETSELGAVTAYYAAERWTLSRVCGAKSRAPERARIIDCPNCGAPLDKLVGGTCGYCNMVVDRGGLDWRVGRIEIVSREARPPMLTGTTEEVGTSDPTVVAPDVQDRWRSLVARDPALGWDTLTARVDLVFRTFHAAWRQQDLAPVRPFLSDNLFQAQTYWVEAYKRQRLRNLTDGARIVGVQLARIVSDARYDAITVRVFATGLDYTVDEHGAVVGGSRDRERAYSEYWTLIRGIDRTGAPRVDPVCPSCGAGLDVNMAGKCAHCGAKVTAGEFDWVLSRSEQDEVYG